MYSFRLYSCERLTIYFVTQHSAANREVLNSDIIFIVYTYIVYYTLQVHIIISIFQSPVRKLPTLRFEQQL